MGRENKELTEMPTCYCLPNFQCFQTCVSWTPLCISPSVVSLMP